MFRSLLCGMLPPDRKSPISSFPPTSIRHPRTTPTPFPRLPSVIPGNHHVIPGVPAVIPAKAGIWMRDPTASPAPCVCAGAWSLQR